MNCLICRQAETVNGLASVHFERGEMKLTVNHVPAWICPNCKEAYVEEQIAVSLLRDAEKMLDAGVIDAMINFME